MPIALEPEVRLAQKTKIDPVTGCWIWTGGTQSIGYGMMRYDNKMQCVHRVAYMLHHGVKLGRYDFIVHTCDNKLCVNPDHLVLVKSRSAAEEFYKAKGIVKNSFGLNTRLECPHCGIKTTPGLAHRWHFDNCKHKKGDK